MSIAWTMGSLFLLFVYNLDLRTYIIEPYFETLPETIRDIDMKNMFALYAQPPVDVDQIKVGWSRFIHKHTIG